MGLGTVLSKYEEDTIIRWLNELREKGVSVTLAMLRVQAVHVAADAGYSITQIFIVLAEEL